MTRIFQDIIIKKVVENRMMANLIESGISKPDAQKVIVYQKQKKREAWKQLQFEVEETIKSLIKSGYTIHELEAST